MTSDITRFEANERVDLEDFKAAIDETLRANIRQTGKTFWADPAKARSWILDGFAISYASDQLTVALGRAILGEKDGGQTFYGNLTDEGDASRTVSVASHGNGMFGIYIRFELIDGNNNSRAFWNPTGAGSEIAQTIATRRLANWSLRVELTNPGAEWLKIGEATVTGAPAETISGTTTQRDFYFEGEEHNSYESGWSTEGGGIANDRNADRATYGVHDLHTFNQAMRQCITDIRGRGLREWYEKGIGGLCINFDTDPTAERIAVQDANCYFGFPTPGGVDAYLQFDTDGRINYNRSTNRMYFLAGSSPVMDLQATLASFEQNINAKDGIAVGYLQTTPTDDAVSVGDDNFGVFYESAGATKRFRFTATDQWVWNSNVINGAIAGVTEFRLKADGLVLDNGLCVGFNGTPLGDIIQIGDADFYLKYDSGGDDAYIYFDGVSDYLKFDRGTSVFHFQIGGASYAIFDPADSKDIYLSPATGMWSDPDNVNAELTGYYIRIDAGDFIYIPVPWPEGYTVTGVHAAVANDTSANECRITFVTRTYDSVSGAVDEFYGGSGVGPGLKDIIITGQSETWAPGKIAHLRLEMLGGGGEFISFYGAKITYTATKLGFNGDIAY